MQSVQSVPILDSPLRSVIKSLWTFTRFSRCFRRLQSDPNNVAVARSRHRLPSTISL